MSEFSGALAYLSEVKLGSAEDPKALVMSTDTVYFTIFLQTM
jgi:hypothetical protein